MNRNTRRQGAISWLWIGFVIVLILVAAYVVIGLLG